MGATPWDEGPSAEEIAALGNVFPSDWVSPVFAGGLEDARSRFTGTAGFLGDDFFISAAHVFPEGDHNFWMIATDTPAGVHKACAVVEWERHPDQRVDLVVGRVSDWSMPSPYTGIGHPTLSAELKCHGFPEDLEIRDDAKRTTAYGGRFLKGHMTRQLPAGAFGADAPSMELSFPIPKGMSGSPIYHEPPFRGGRSLIGVALRSQASHLAEHESIFQREIEPPDRIYRIVEYGIGIRLSAFVRWHIRFADRTLADLVRASQG